MALYPLIRPLLFRLEPETAHGLVTGGAALLGRLPGMLRVERALYGYDHPSLRTRLWGLEFPNPVGLAAGFDKDARLVKPLLALGFGFLEVGTVTPRGQPGNERPRLFRLGKERALINRMGFNNQGALALARRLEKVPARAGRIGVNLGKNLETPLEEAASDYLTGLHAVFPSADYFVVNVSSPNTPGLRKLQEKSSLMEMASLLGRERDKLSQGADEKLPFLIKIAPDLSEAELADVVEVALDCGVDGLIATNTTTRREGLTDSQSEQAGGLSGAPLRLEALRTIATLHRLCGGRIPLIGVGGVASAEQAYALICSGASLVQLYTGLVYQGPGLVRGIKRDLARLLARDGFSTISAAVGSGPGAG